MVGSAAPPRIALRRAPEHYTFSMTASNNRDSGCLHIADTHFHIHTDRPLPPAQANKTYAEFIGENAGKHSSTNFDINVTLSEGQLAQADKHTPIFQTDNGWSLMDTGDEYLFSSLFPSIENKFSWNVFCDKDFSNVRIILPPNSMRHWLNGGSGIPSLQYPLDQILLYHHMASRSGLLIHTAGIKIHSQGWLFSGPSGAGKSTISGMLLNNKDAHVINDDRMIVRHSENNGWVAHGTPWPGDLGIAENTSTPLHALCFLARGDKLKLTALDPIEALRHLFPVASIPWYLEDLMTQSLELCEKLISDIPVYEICFKPGDSIIDVLGYDKAA